MCIVCKINITRGKKKGFVDFSKKLPAGYFLEMKYFGRILYFCSRECKKIERMKRVFAFILSILSLYGSAVYANGEVEAAKSMVVRLLPDYANHFEFRLIPNDNGRDCFSIESQGDKIVISGNTAGSMAVGLNAYLTRHCRTSVSWYAENPVAMPDTLPAVPKKEYAFARVERRFFLNYCTFGYSMPFWDWTEWERMID